MQKCYASHDILLSAPVHQDDVMNPESLLLLFWKMLSALSYPMRKS